MANPDLAHFTTGALLREIIDRSEGFVAGISTKEQFARDGEYHCVTHGAAFIQSGLVDELRAHIRDRQMRHIQDWHDAHDDQP